MAPQGRYVGRGLWQEQPAFHHRDTWLAPRKAFAEEPICTPARGEKQPSGEKHPPTLPPYLGWENIIHHVPDVRAHDTLVGQRQAFQLHRDRADDAVLRLVALLVEENPPRQGKVVG